MEGQAGQKGETVFKHRLSFLTCPARSIEDWPSKTNLKINLYSLSFLDVLGCLGGQAGQKETRCLKTVFGDRPGVRYDFDVLVQMNETPQKWFGVGSQATV